MIIVCFGLTFANVWSYMNKKFLVCCYLLKRGKLGGGQEWVRWERKGVSKLVGESGGWVGRESWGERRVSEWRERRWVSGQREAGEWVGERGWVGRERLGDEWVGEGGGSWGGWVGESKRDVSEWGERGGWVSEWGERGWVSRERWGKW